MALSKDSVMSKFLTLTVLTGLLALVATDLPVDVDSIVRNTEQDIDLTIYRIPEDLDPIHFEVEITPYFEDAPAGKENFTFDGIVTILFKAVKANINSLFIHERVKEIDTITLTDTNNVPIQLNANQPYERIREYQFLKINLAEGVTLENGKEYRVRITYEGFINETPLQRGVFRGNYRDQNGKLHWYAATHLQPVNSRQAFPCFDEPGFKSTFDIIVNRQAHFTETYSNMAIKSTTENGDRVREVFHTTPRMSAYLVTLHISEEFEVIADNRDPLKSYRILARPEARGQGEYALEVGPPVTKWLDDYLGIEYYSMADNIKNDQIASPYWASGATENWGLVTYRELRLLYEEGETSAVDKMSIGTITAHELAHKWFGNLITCRWWDNVWINEGFASYFEYFAMDGVDKTMELEDQFNIMYVQSALSADSSINTRALQHTVNSPAQVTGHFSGISYSKGASLLLMLKHFVGEATFKKALNLFLTEMEYEHAYPADLYRAFAKAVEEDSVDIGTDIADFMNYWVEEPGYPVLNVKVDMTSGVISLEQHRFYISTSAPESKQFWPLPLTYTTGNNPNWENLTPTKVMTEETDEIVKGPGHEWVIFNIQQKGIYRVNYDTHNWEMLAAALSSNYNDIHYLNRAQIVDDVFALMRSEQMNLVLGFKVLDFLKQDTSYYSWYPAISGFNWLRNRFLHLPDVLAAFDAVLYEFLNAVIENLGFEVVPQEPLTRTLNRFYVLNFACNIRHEACVNNAVTKFKSYTTNGTPVNPNLRRHVFCEGLRDGGYDEWKILFDRRQKSNNQADEVAMLRALGCSTDNQSRKEYLDMILNDDIVKAQDRVNAFTFLMMGDRSNARVVLDYLKENADAIRKGVYLQAWFDSIISNVAAYLDVEGLQDMEQWLNANSATFPEYQLGLNSVASARASQAWGTEKAQLILTAARGSAATLLPTVLMMFTAVLALLLK